MDTNSYQNILKFVKLLLHLYKLIITYSHYFYTKYTNVEKRIHYAILNSM